MNRTLREACWLLPLALLSCQGDTLDWNMPAASDRGWWKGFATQGTDAPVLALAVHDSLLVAGGYFQHAGPVAAACVATWDGTAWQALGSGLQREGCPGNHCDAWVASLTSFQGALIAGGRFTAAGGVSAANVARWDGSSWSQLGEGLDGTVLALAVDDGQLYAGGEFTRTGADSVVGHVARWDGTGWRRMAAGVDGTVRALCSTRSGLVVGGDFVLAGTDTVNYLARWTVGGWQKLPSYEEGPVHALVEWPGTSGTDLMVAYRSVPPASNSGVVELRETGMYHISAPPNPVALSFFHGDFVVGGDPSYFRHYYSGVVRFAIRTSVEINGDVFGQVMTLCVLGDHLYLGGRFESVGDTPSPHIARWED
jgi:hypothetical protein